MVRQQPCPPHPPTPHALPALLAACAPAQHQATCPLTPRPACPAGRRRHGRRHRRRGGCSCRGSTGAGQPRQQLSRLLERGCVVGAQPRQAALLLHRRRLVHPLASKRAAAAASWQLPLRRACRSWAGLTSPIPKVPSPGAGGMQGRGAMTRAAAATPRPSRAPPRGPRRAAGARPPAPMGAWSRVCWRWPRAGRCWPPVTRWGRCWCGISGRRGRRRTGPGRRAGAAAAQVQAAVGSNARVVARRRGGRGVGWPAPAGSGRRGRDAQQRLLPPPVGDRWGAAWRGVGALTSDLCLHSQVAAARPHCNNISISNFHTTP